VTIAPGVFCNALSFEIVTKRDNHSGRLRQGQHPGSDKRCQLNRSMQHLTQLDVPAAGGISSVQ
jgi:hypothetical protein